ncbi:Peptidase inhibitor R3HDML isoform X2 [Aix galericulata]|nr:Peptidase inhibitor R3HDML isoform X2 [Aix galericulata]
MPPDHGFCFAPHGQGFAALLILARSSGTSPRAFGVKSWRYLSLEEPRHMDGVVALGWPGSVAPAEVLTKTSSPALLPPAECVCFLAPCELLSADAPPSQTPVGGTGRDTHPWGSLPAGVSRKTNTKPPSSQRAASLPAGGGCVCKRRARGAGYKPPGRALPKPQHVPRGEELRCSFCVTLPRAARLGWVKSLAHVPRAGSLCSAPRSGPVARSSSLTRALLRAPAGRAAMPRLRLHLCFTGVLCWLAHEAGSFALPNATELLSPPSSAGPGPAPGTGVPRSRRRRALAPREVSAILDYHNQVRAQVSPPAANMEYMVWDERLARAAEAWAVQCVWEHGPPQLMKYVGQNLSIHSGRYRSVVDMVRSWHREQQHFSFPHPRECNPRCPSKCSGSVCSHYTQAVCPGAGWAQKRDIEKPPLGGRVVPGWAQHPPRELGLLGLGPCPAAGAGSADHPLSVLAQMVWASSNRLGCAIHACSNVRVWGSTWHRAVLLVCNYAIKGNWIGEAPYKVGRPCSACPPSYGGVCSNNMCFTGLKSNQVGWL